LRILRTIPRRLAFVLTFIFPFQTKLKIWCRFSFKVPCSVVAHYSAKLPEDTSRDSTRYALKRLSLRLTDPEKLSILRSEDVQRILHGRIGSRNDICISKSIGHTTDNEKADIRY
jgi:hypothetical protein